MIYLIKSAAFKIGGSLEVILKIGYTKEDGIKARFNAYLTENPTCEVIALIPDGDTQDETNLHHHFRNYKKPYGNEWFEECDEIYEFFKTHTTKESLNDITPHYSTRKSAEVRKIIIQQIEDKHRFISPILSDLEGSEYILKKEKILEELEEVEDYETYLIEHYPEVDFHREYIESPGVTKCVEEFNSITATGDKLEYFLKVEEQLITTEERLSFLNQIPSKFRDYYFIFGTTKLKALEYKEAYILREWKRIKDNALVSEVLRKRIYEEFSIGVKYFKYFIKERLREIYTEVGYDACPKAVDLEKYFEVRQVMITDRADGKRKYTFEIISKK